VRRRLDRVFFNVRRTSYVSFAKPLPRGFSSSSCSRINVHRSFTNSAGFQNNNDLPEQSIRTWIQTVFVVDRKCDLIATVFLFRDRQQLFSRTRKSIPRVVEIVPLSRHRARTSRRPTEKLITKQSTRVCR